MAIPWVTVLKLVPWTEVIRNAPAVLDSARKLLDSSSRKSAWTPPQPTPAATALSGDSTAVEARIASLESSVAGLQEQALATSELIKELAEQNTNLIKRAELNRQHVQRLSYAAVVIGIIAVVALSLVLKG